MPRRCTGKYAAREPFIEVVPDSKTASRRIPSRIDISNALQPGGDTYMKFRWLQGMPNPPIKLRSSESDKIVAHIGTETEDPQDRGPVIYKQMDRTVFHIASEPGRLYL